MIAKTFTEYIFVKKKKGSSAQEWKESAYL